MGGGSLACQVHARHARRARLGRAAACRLWGWLPWLVGLWGCWGWGGVGRARSWCAWSGAEAARRNRCGPSALGRVSGKTMRRRRCGVGVGAEEMEMGAVLDLLGHAASWLLRRDVYPIGSMFSFLGVGALK